MKTPKLDKFIDKNYGGVNGYSYDDNGKMIDAVGGYNHGSSNYFSELGEVLKEIQILLNQ